MIDTQKRTSMPIFIKWPLILMPVAIFYSKMRRYIFCIFPDYVNKRKWGYWMNCLLGQSSCQIILAQTLICSILYFLYINNVFVFMWMIQTNTIHNLYFFQNDSKQQEKHLVNFRFWYCTLHQRDRLTKQKKWYCN